MVLSAISALSVFPNESILISVHNTPTDVDGRLGISFVDSYYNYENDRLKWSNFPLTTVDTDVNAITALGMPSQRVNMPDVFPMVYTVSGYTDHLHLDYQNEYHLNVYPSRPYPSITYNPTTKVLSISAGLLPLTAFDTDVTTTEYRKKYASPTTSLVPLPAAGTFNGAYKSTAVYGKPVFSYPKTFLNNVIPAFIPLTVIRKPKTGVTTTPNWSLYSEKIIPSSMMAKVNVGGASFSAIGGDLEVEDYSTEYTSYWSRSINAATYASPTTTSHKDLLLSPDIHYANIDTGHIQQLYIVGNVAPVEAYINFKKPSDNKNFYQQLYIRPKVTSPKSAIDSLYFPANTDVNVWFETSAYHINDVGALSPTSSTNFYAISSNTTPIWGYGSSFSYNNQDAFTVNFAPSASIVAQDLSSTSIAIKMVDNFYQTSIDIGTPNNVVRSKFVSKNTSDISSLSAIVLTTNTAYPENSAFDSSSVIKFINSLDGDPAAVYDLNLITTVTWADAAGTREGYYQQPISFTLNPDKAIIYLKQENITTDTVDIVGFISPDYDEAANVQWSVYPPENIVLRDLDNLETIIPQNQNVPGGSLSVRVENLGVGDTIITLHVPQYGRSTSTTWIPSNDIWGSVGMRVLGTVSDYNPVNTGSLSAVFVRKSLRYQVPTNASIRWDSDLYAPESSLTFTTKDGERIDDNVSYISTSAYSIIDGLFTAPRTISNPRSVPFRVNCSIYSPYYAYNASKAFNLREYPLNSSVFIDISSTQNPTIISSKDYSSVVYTTTGTVGLSADVSLSTLNANNTIWSIDDSVSTYTGSSIMFDMTGTEVCVSISGLNATPTTGGFGPYNFYDTVCFYVLSTLAPFDYISFPEKNYLPTTEMNFDNYTSEYLGLSSYKACHTENIYFSATPGFDDYRWSVGDTTTSTATNTALVPVVMSDVSAVRPVSVRAFNRYFPSTDPLSVYNSASSNGTTFRQELSANPFPATTLTFTLDNPLVDMRDVLDRTVNMNASFSTLDISASTFSIVFSSTEGLYERDITFYDNNVDFSGMFNYGDVDVFRIEENSTYEHNVFLKGVANKTISEFDFCTESQPITSNILTLTAFDGPDLSIWTPFNVLTGNEIVSITNTTHNTFLNPFTSFTFEDGLGNISTNLNFGPFTATYPTGDNTYTVSMSGFRTDGSVLTAAWPQFFVIEEGALYDPNVGRDTSIPLTLPYTIEDIVIPANSWQFSQVLNTSFNRIKSNIDYLNANCFLIQNLLPKYNLSTYGTHRGVTEWRYDTNLTDLDSEGNNRYTDLLLYKNYILLINDSKIEIRSNDHRMTLLSQISLLSEVETFVAPTRMQVINGRIIILDEAKNSVYVCDLDESTLTLKVTHYWGGVGAKNSRTKLNKPTDLLVLSDTIYIVDNASDNLKVYNKFLNWTSNIPILSPVAVSGYDDTIFVLTTFGRVHRFENLVEVDVFDAVVGSAIAYSADHHKLYIVQENSVHVFSENGTAINTLHHIPIKDLNNVVMHNKEIYVLSHNVIVKMFDPLNYEQMSTLTTYTNPDISYRVHRNEPVTSFVINDSVAKLYNILTTLNNSLTSEVLRYYDDMDTFLYSSLSATSFTTDCAISNLGVNEIVSYETINRGILELHNCVMQSKDFIDGRSYYPAGPPVWTWIYHKVSRNQRPNQHITPLSWEELSSANPEYSAITWDNIRFSTGYENNFPVNWRWVDLSSNCLNATMWSEMESGARKDHTWESLEAPIPNSPPTFLFDSCK